MSTSSNDAANYNRGYNADHYDAYDYDECSYDDFDLNSWGKGGSSRLMQKCKEKRGGGGGGGESVYSSKHIRLMAAKRKRWSDNTKHHPRANGDINITQSQNLNKYEVKKSWNKTRCCDDRG